MEVEKIRTMENDLIKNFYKNNIILSDFKEDKIINNEKQTAGFLISNKLGYGSIIYVIIYLIFIKLLNEKIIKKNEDTNIFIIQETYTIKGIGIYFMVIKKGQISRNDVLQIGPIGGKFHNIHIRNVRDNDNDVETLYEDQLGYLAIKQLSKDFTFKRDQLKSADITSNYIVVMN